MKFPKIMFRVLVPGAVVLLGLFGFALPFFGALITIGEGRNPYFYWFGLVPILAAPGYFLIRPLVYLFGLPELFIWWIVALLLNIGIYFSVGCLMDYVFGRMIDRLEVRCNP